jgi:hypothetical protein
MPNRKLPADLLSSTYVEPPPVDVTKEGAYIDLEMTEDGTVYTLYFYDPEFKRETYIPVVRVVGVPNRYRVWGKSWSADRA